MVKLKLLCCRIVFIKVDDFKIFPLCRNLFPLCLRAIVCAHTVGLVCCNPIKSAEAGSGSDFLHEGLCACRNKILRKISRYFEIKFNLICKAVEIILNRKIFTEVKEVFKLVAVCIELSVEVLCDKPVGVKELFGAGKAERAEKKLFKFIVGNSVFLTGTDVEEVVPEIRAEVTCGIFCNKVAHKSARILNSAPFKNAVDRNMEHDGIHIFKNVGVKNTALAHYNPILDAAFNESALCNSL